LQRKLRQRSNSQLEENLVECVKWIDVQLRKGELRRYELQQMRIVEHNVICEPKKAEVLGEDDGDIDRRLDKNLTENENQQRRLMFQTSKEVTRNVFKTNSLCVIAGDFIDKSLEVRYDGECLLNEEFFYLLQHKELIDELLFGETQPFEVLMKRE